MLVVDSAFLLLDSRSGSCGLIIQSWYGVILGYSVAIPLVLVLLPVSSKSPQFVLKAAFHWSPSRIRTLLYSHQTSNLVNHLAPLSLSNNSIMRDKG